MGKHIVAVLDDWGLSGVGALAASILGHSDPPTTPVIDGLASAGIVFREYRTPPVCSTTRAALLTGRMPYLTGVGDNVLPTNELPDSSETAWLPGLLTSHTSALMGKGHLGNFTNGFTRWATDLAGFDRWRGPFSNLVGQIQNPVDSAFYDQSYFWFAEIDSDDWDGNLGSDVAIVGQADGPANTEAANYATTRQVDQAVEWMEEQVGDWLLVLALNAPHAPLHLPPASLLSAPSQTLRAALAQLQAEDLDQADQPARLGEILGTPGAFTTLNQVRWQSSKLAIEAADTELGRLLESSAVDLASDTTIWVVGDNGPATDVVVPPEIPADAKNTQKDTGLRSPCIVRGAEVGMTGTCTGLVSPVDILPTICALEGVSLPGGVTFSGVDISAALANPSAATGRDYLLAEQFSPEGPLDFSAAGFAAQFTDPKTQYLRRSMTGNGYKLIREYDLRDGSIATSQLYKLDEDPRELSNLLNEPDEETFASCGENCETYLALRRLQREFDLVTPGAGS